MTEIRTAFEDGDAYDRYMGLDAGPGQRASVYTYVDVPDFSRQPLSLSGIVLGVSPEVGVAPADAFKDITSVIPTARRELARTDRASAFHRVYQDAKAAVLPATVTARIHNPARRRMPWARATLWRAFLTRVRFNPLRSNSGRSSPRASDGQNGHLRSVTTRSLGVHAVGACEIIDLVRSDRSVSKMMS